MSRIQVRRGPAAEWTSTNEVLGSGEPGYETDTGKVKFGDGASAWVDLPYLQGEIDDPGDGDTIINNYLSKVPFGICQSELAHGSYTGFENETKIRQVLQGIQDTGATYVRVAAWWNVIEPIKDGGYSWTGMDLFLNTVDDYGLTPLVCMTSPAPTGATIADFGQLCAAIAGRYGSNGTGQLKHYEVWNEENNVTPAGPFNTGATPFGPATYTALLIAGTTAIRAQDPEAVVLLGGLLSTVDYPPSGDKTDYLPSTFLQGIYDNGGGDYFDVFNVHWYSGDVSFVTGWEEPRTDHPVYLDLSVCREKLIAHADEDKEFWITEMGFPITEDMADPVVRARWLIRQIQLVTNLGFVDVWFIYNYKNAPALADGSKFGLVDQSLVKYQPLWDMVANINAVSPAIPTGSIVDDTIPDGSIHGEKLDVTGGGGSGKYLAYGADGSLTASVPAGGGGSSTEMVALGELYEPLLGVWPAVDAVNGPLTSDAGITNSAPSFTGLTYWRWDSGKFNTQSQNWVPIPTLNGVTTNQCCQNVTTDRSNNYASTGVGFPCHADFSFVADTAKVIIAYWVNLQGQLAQSVSTAAHEIQIFAELEGQLKGIREAPAFWPHASGGGAQLMYRVLTFKQARKREFRVMLSTDAWFAGVYIDTGAQITKAPNRPVLALCYGDSWGEGAGNVYSFFGGNGSAAGVTWPSGCSLLYSNTALQYAIATGFAVIIAHQGGTGYFVQNSGTVDVDDGTTTPGGFTVFGSQNSTNFAWTTFGSRHPIVIFPGGWNDGSRTTADYKARALKVWGKQIAKDSTVPILVEGIQSKAVTPGSGSDLANTGLIQAAADASMADNVIGFINNLVDADYSDISTSGYNNIGPDGLHPTVKGGNLIGVNRAKRSAAFLIPHDRVIAMRTA